MPTKAKEEQDIPAKVRDELRRVITVHAYGMIWTKTGMKMNEQEMDVFQTFHGDSVAERASHKAMLCNAQGPYEKLYNKLPITNNDPTSKSIQKYYYTLRPVFLGQVSTGKWKTPPLYVAGDQINIGVLERSVKDKADSPFVSSRSLFNSARNCLANIREMISVVSFWTKEGMPKKSGDNWDLVLERVLDHMWNRNDGKEAAKDTKLVSVEEIGASYKAQQEKEKSTAGGTASERPNGWIPQGWMAFLLFGPTPYKAKLLPLTELGDAQPKAGESKKQFGRKSHRDNAAKEKDIIRNNDPQERGMSKSQQLVAVGLQQRMIIMESMDKQTKILTNQKNLAFLEKKAERLLRVATHRGTSDAWALYEKAEAELNAAVENSKESPVKNEESKKAIASFLNDVLPTKNMTPLAKRRLDGGKLTSTSKKRIVQEDDEFAIQETSTPSKRRKTDASVTSGSTSTFLVATQPNSDTPSDLDSFAASEHGRHSDFPLAQPTDTQETTSRN